jgi:PAS domain S-box-containing protein
MYSQQDPKSALSKSKSSDHKFQQQLRYLFLHAPAAIALLEGPEHIYTFANPLYRKIFNRSEDELIGKTLREVFPEVEGQGIYELFDQAYHSARSFTASEFPASFRDGDSVKIGYYNFVIQPIQNEEGKVTDLMVHVYEVTNQVEAKKKLEESESKYRGLFTSMDQGFCVIEMIFDDSGKPVDYRFLEVNPVFESQTGLKDASGKTARELVPSLEERWYQLYGDVASTGNSVRFTEGSETMGRWFDVNAFRLGGDGSKTVAILFSDITKKKQDEKQLLQSEQYFRQLTDTVPAIIWITRPDGYCTYLNKNWYDFTGQSEGEAEGFGWLNATHPDDSEEAGRQFMNATHARQPYYMLYRLRHKTGEYRWAIDSGQPKFGADGSFEGMIGTVIDVHEQKLAADKISESEKRFRSMADASPVMIWTLDEKGNSTYYNTRAREFTGDTEEELANGKTWQLAIHPDDIGYASGVVTDAVTKRIPYEMECRMKRADGEWRSLLNQGIPRFGEKGEYFGFVGSSVDITERKASQQALETALEQMRLSKEAAELGTFDMDLEKGTMHWDDRCRLLFGISHRNAVTYERDFAGGLHPDDRDRVLRLIDRLFVKSISNGDYDVEYRTIGAEDGIVRWVRAKGKVYFNEQEKPVRFIGSVLDITDKVMAVQQIEALVEKRTKELAQANEALQKINKDLQRSNQNLEEFAHVASHDLKEPVRKIQIFTNQLKEKLNPYLGDAERRSFSRIESSAERMGSLIEDLLLYSQISQGPREPESVDLNDNVQRVLEDLELIIEEKQALVECLHLPKVRGQRGQLQQLFHNLISNSLKYSKEDAPPHIIVFADKIRENGNAYHVISVKDNGIGFDEVYAEKIFQIFTRLHSQTDYTGTGVGLSIVKRVVENHNGFVRVNSMPGKGSIFQIFLPIEPENSN